jgi:hypothetical protein
MVGPKADASTIVCNLQGQYGRPLQVLALNTEAGWVEDVSQLIARKVRAVAHRGPDTAKAEVALEYHYKFYAIADAVAISSNQFRFVFSGRVKDADDATYAWPGRAPRAYFCKLETAHKDRTAWLGM